MSVLDAETAVLAKMPNQTLTVVTGGGDYLQMAQARNEIYQNLSAVPTTYGTGLDGHLGLAMSAAQYQLRAGQAFTIPVDPGPYDLTIGANVGVNAKARREALHQEARQAYKIYLAVNSVIKNQLKQAMPRETIREIENEIDGLNGLTIIAIIDHCMDRLGQINDTLVDENRVHANEPFDANGGMAAYIRRIEQCQLLANDANEPFSDKQLVRMGQIAVGRTGFFNLEYKDWIKKAAADKTWPNFKTFWMDAYKMYDDMNKLTATESGFGANSMEQQITNAGNDIALESAMDNLVAVMSSDRNAIDEIIATNAMLAEQNRVKDTTIARMAAENANLVLIMTKMVGNKPVTEKLPPATKDGGRKLKKPDDTPFDPNGYCWSHGYRVHFDHNSPNCKYKRDGHIVCATRANNMGGSQRNKEWIKSK